MRRPRFALEALGLLSLVGACRTTAKKDTPIAPPSAATPVVSVAAVESAKPAPEAPLAWGTRPNSKGPLYPLVDGTCSYGEIWPAGDHAVFTYRHSGYSTYARIDDDGLAVDPKLEKAVPVKAGDDKTQQALAWSSPRAMYGAWPALTLYSHVATRLRPQESLWTFGEGGWTALEGSYQDDEPFVLKPVVVKGRLVTARAWWSGKGADAKREQVMKSWPLGKDAPAIAGLNSLLRANFEIERLEATSDAIYSYGPDNVPNANQIYHYVRMLKDGKVSEARYDWRESDPQTLVFEETLFEVGPREIFRYEGIERKKLPFKLAPGVTINGSAIAKNGDVWIKTTKDVIQVLHDGALSETTLPAPATKPKDDPAAFPSSGNALAGVDLDDPWAVGAYGALYHFENGSWTEVELPAPPFATTGKYAAQSLVMKTKGDLFVNAGYSEKGVGWKTAERYRAILRTKRPKEVLRCNEDLPHKLQGPPGLSSAPPIADDTCPTPFVLLVPLGQKGSPNFAFGREQKFPALRKVIKDTPSLGATVDIVEVPFNGQLYAGMAAPTMAAAKELALATSKRVKADFYQTRPEILCGTPPKVEKTITVDVASGEVAK